MQDLKNNPLISVLLAVLTVISAAMFASNMNANNQLWAKLDRVTTLMLSERDLMRTDMKDIQKLALCHDKELAEIKERIKGHVEFTDRELFKLDPENNRNGKNNKKAGGT